MKLSKYFFFVLFILSFGNRATAKANEGITLEQLNQMFEDMRSSSAYKKEGIDGNLLWGYFFTATNPKILQPVADYLTKNGYHFVEIYPTDNKTTFFLHVEKIEHHTPESLNKRNQEFYKLAKKFHLESYDGMDVGPVK